jgi:hypothetical protein
MALPWVMREFLDSNDSRIIKRSKLPFDDSMFMSFHHSFDSDPPHFIVPDGYRYMTCVEWLTDASSFTLRLKRAYASNNVQIGSSSGGFLQNVNVSAFMKLPCVFDITRSGGSRADFQIILRKVL